MSPWFDVSATSIDTKSKKEDINRQSDLRTLLIIISAPRCGSYHLCRILWELGYGMPAEYFNPFFAHALRRYEKRPLTQLRALQIGLRRRLHSWLGRASLRACPGLPDPDCLASLVQERTARSRLTGQPFFSVKLQAHQLGRLGFALQHVFAPMVCRGLWKSFEAQPPSILLLYRRDLAAAVASFHYSLCCGSFDQGRIFSYQHRSLSALGNHQALRTDLAAYHIHLEWLVDALRSSPFPIFCLAFEDLVDQQDRLLEELLPWLDTLGHCDSQTTRRQGEGPQLRSELLDFRIARDPSPWDQERRLWLRHITDRLQQERLLEHSRAIRCKRLIGELNDHCVSVNG